MATLTKKEWDQIRGRRSETDIKYLFHAPTARRRDHDREGRERDEGREQRGGRMTRYIEEEFDRCERLTAES